MGALALLLAAIVPLLMSKRAFADKNNSDFTSSLAGVIKRVLAKQYDKTLFIATSNLSPGRNHLEPEMLIRIIRERDEESLLRGLRNGEIDSCGAHCVLPIFFLLPGPYRAELLCLSEPEDVDRNDPAAVRYAAVSFHDEESS